MSFLFEGQLAYVTSAYLITGLVFAILIMWALIDRKKQIKTLQDLEASGTTRASKKEGSK